MMKVVHVVHYPMFAAHAERMSVVDSVWTLHDDAVKGHID